MKKTYIAPAVAAVKLDATGLMAVSLQVDSNINNAVDTSSDGVQLGRDDHRGSGNVWDQSW
jgi:hypothetical protein